MPTVTIMIAARPYSSICGYDFQRKGLWLALQPRSKPIWIMADAERLELVMSNLLDNAAKYTDPVGQVIVSIPAENAETVLRVQDTGIGIDRIVAKRV